MILISIDFYDFISLFSPFLKTVFDHIFVKHLKARQKYSAARCIFNSLPSVWKCGQTQFLKLKANKENPVFTKKIYFYGFST